MKILFITNLLPYPLDNGGKIKSYNTLEMMAAGNEIDIFTFYEDDKENESLEYMKRKYNNINAIKRTLTTSRDIKKMLMIAFKSLFNKLPFVLLKYKDKEMSKILNASIIEGKYDLIYIDHLQLGVYWDILKKAKCPIYLDQHNCESQILKRKVDSTTSFIKRKFVNVEYKKLKKFEDFMIENSDKIIVLTEEDKKSLLNGMSNNVKDEKFVVIPIPVESDYKKDIGIRLTNKINIMFLGTLSWHPNLDGVKWFINRVVPILDSVRIDYKLFIVGKNPDKALQDMCKRNKNIELTGYVDDVNEYINICDVMVVPIFVGSGMRVKILEALGKRIPIISTSIGVEGIFANDGEEVLIANNENEFIKQISTLMKNDELYCKLQKNGHCLFENNYSIEAIVKKYRKSVLNIK